MRNRYGVTLFRMFINMVEQFLEDDEITYKEAYELLYWLEDHEGFANQNAHLYARAKEVLEDDKLDLSEAGEIKYLLKETISKYR